MKRYSERENRRTSACIQFLRTTTTKKKNEAVATDKQHSRHGVCSYSFRLLLSPILSIKIGSNYGHIPVYIHLSLLVLRSQEDTTRTKTKSVIVGALHDFFFHSLFSSSSSSLLIFISFLLVIWLHLFRLHFAHFLLQNHLHQNTYYYTIMQWQLINSSLVCDQQSSKSLPIAFKVSSYLTLGRSLFLSFALYSLLIQPKIFCYFKSFPPCSIDSFSFHFLVCPDEKQQLNAKKRIAQHIISEALNFSEHHKYFAQLDEFAEEMAIIILLKMWRIFEERKRTTATAKAKTQQKQ